MAGISKNSISTGSLDGLDSLGERGSHQVYSPDRQACTSLYVIVWCICHQISRNVHNQISRSGRTKLPEEHLKFSAISFSIYYSLQTEVSSNCFFIVNTWNTFYRNHSLKVFSDRQLISGSHNRRWHPLLFISCCAITSWMIKSQNSAADSNVPRDDNKRQAFAKPAQMKEGTQLKVLFHFPNLAIWVTFLITINGCLKQGGIKYAGLFFPRHIVLFISMIHPSSCSAIWFADAPVRGNSCLCCFSLLRI